MALEWGSVERFWELLWSWRDSGRAALVASHAHDAIERADGVMELGDGRPDDHRDDDARAAEPRLAVTACTSVAPGTALGALAARELEGALALFILAGLQFMADPPSTLAHLLPFWSTRELATHAIDGADAASLDAAITHAALTVLLCGLVTVAATAHRLTPGPGGHGRQRARRRRRPA